MKTAAGVTNRLLLALAWIAAIALALTMLYPARHMLDRTGPLRYFPWDFTQFYVAGQLAADGRIAELYQPQAYEPLILGAGIPLNHAGPYPIIRPAFVAYLCVPLTWFPFRTALLLVALANVTLLIVLVWKLPVWFSLPRAGRAGLLAFYPFIWSIGLSQDSLLLTLLMAAGFYLASRERHAAGGVMLGLCVFKPHLVWLVPLAWLIGGKRRAAVWFAASAFALALISFVSVGLGGFREWMHLLQQPYSDYKPETMGNLRALAGHFGPLPAVIAGGLIVICLILILRRGSLDQKLSAAVLTGLLLSPHTYLHDFCLLAVITLLATHPAVWYAALLPWPYFYPRDDLLPWIIGILVYLVLMAVRPSLFPQRTKLPATPGAAEG